MKINKILVPTDFSETANQAVKQALELASRHDADVVVLHARVMYEDDPNRLLQKLDALKGTEKEIEQRLLTQLKEPTETHGQLNINHEIIRGYSASSAILTYLKENDFDLLVIGTHGRTGLGHFLIGSVAEKVVRYASCPVLTMPHDTAINIPLQKIVVPFDFSDHAQHALKTALDLAVIEKSDLHLVYIIENDVHPALYTWGVKTIFDVIPDIEKKAKARMDEVIGKLKSGVDVKIEKHIGTGMPHKELAKYIKSSKADLVIIATEGLVGLDRFLLGSTTEKIIRSVPKPILTLKLKS